MSRPNSRYDTLERMLNKTTLSVQRVTHRHIIEHGQKAFVQTSSEETSDKEKAIQVALEAAEARFAREIKSVTDRLRKEKEEQRVEELRAQKAYYEKHMAHVSEQRDLLEEARVSELRRQFDMEKEAALRAQEDRLRAEAAAELAEMQRAERGRAEAALREEFAAELATAVRRAEEECARQKEAALAQLREVLKEEEAERRRRQGEAHEAALAAEVARYERLMEQLRLVLHHNREIEADFQLLQKEYKRFLDNTNGMFDSSYLLQQRQHSLQLPGIDLDIEGLCEAPEVAEKGGP